MDNFNRYNQNDVNTQGNNGIPNNQPLNNQNFNTTQSNNMNTFVNQNQQLMNNNMYNQNGNYNFDPMTGQPIQQPTQNTTNMNSQQPKKNNKVFIIIAIIAVIAIIAGIFLFTNQDKKEPVNNEPPNNSEVENDNNNSSSNEEIDDESTDSKQEISIVVIGQEDHGKTTLTSAITKLYGEYVSYEDVVDVDEYKYLGVKYNVSKVEYETQNRHYIHYDLLSHEDYVKSIISGAIEVDGAILVVSGADGVMPQTREQLKMLYNSGVSKVVVYISKCDIVKDESLLDLVEIEIRELLANYGFEGKDTPIVRGSALKAIEGDAEGEQSVRNLISEVDKWIKPVKGKNKDFLMAIEDVFKISGRGTTVTGRVDRGTVKKGDTVQIIGLNDEFKTAIVSDIEMFRNQKDYAETGDNVGILLKDITTEEVKRGQVLAKPSSIKSSTKFETTVYFLSKEEKKEAISLSDGYKAQFYFRTFEINGVINLPKNVKVINPGDVVSFSVSLDSPVAMELGTSFSIRINKNTVAMGRVTKIN